MSAAGITSPLPGALAVSGPAKLSAVNSCPKALIDSTDSSLFRQSDDICANVPWCGTCTITVVKPARGDVSTS